MAGAAAKIIHLDMDAFYASVEQRDFPAYRGRPVVVGGRPDSRGVVATCSYEARRFGIHSAMPAAHARRLCPDAIFLRPRFQVYRSVSRRIRGIFGEYTSLVEPLSLDEAYLDVTGSRRHRGSAMLLAREIKARIADELSLTASAGVSYNKFLAKLASDMEKPDGLTVITPEQGPDTVAALPVRRFHGIGPATASRLHAIGVHTGRDLRCADPALLARVLGRSTAYFQGLARGEDPRRVTPSRPRKSLGSERTFQQDLRTAGQVLEAAEALAEEVAQALRRAGAQARTVSLKIKYADFRLITRSRTFSRPLREAAELKAAVPMLLAETRAGREPIRLVGVALSGLEPDARGCSGEQLSLFQGL